MTNITFGIIHLCLKACNAYGSTLCQWYVSTNPGPDCVSKHRYIRQIQQTQMRVSRLIIFWELGTSSQNWDTI